MQNKTDPCKNTKCIKYICIWKMSTRRSQNQFKCLFKLVINCFFSHSLSCLCWIFLEYKGWRRKKIMAKIITLCTCLYYYYYCYNNVSKYHYPINYSRFALTKSHIIQCAIPMWIAVLVTQYWWWTVHYHWLTTWHTSFADSPLLSSST